MIIIWFSYKFKELFLNSANFILFLGKKGRFLSFWIVWGLFAFAFLSYTGIFWRKLSIFHFNLIIISLSYKTKELFPNLVNVTLFRAPKREIFDFFNWVILWNVYAFAFLSYTRIVWRKKEESCILFILIWLVSDFLTSLTNFFQIQLIWPILGPTRGIFDFLS